MKIMRLRKFHLGDESWLPKVRGYKNKAIKLETSKLSSARGTKARCVICTNASSDNA